MKKITLTLLMVLSLFSFAQLSGIYTIGGTSPDYTTINNAVTDLITQGISSNVIFNIRQGTYNEQIEIPNITGVSSTNRITFQSETQNPDDVIITYSPVDENDNYTIYLNGTSYITFNKLTLNSGGTNGYARIIIFDNGTTGISFFNNNIFGVNATPAAYTTAMLIYADNSYEDYDVTISDNHFSDSWDCFIRFRNFTDLNISNNFFENTTFNSTYILLKYLHGTTNVYENTLKGGMLIYTTTSADNIYIERNKIYGRLEIGVTATASNPTLIANNFIFESYIYLNGANYTNVYHNTVYSGTQPQCLYVLNSPNTNMKNNIFSYCTTNTTSQAIRVDDFSNISSMDYNNIYSENAHLAYDGTNFYDSLSEWQTATGFDLNSYNNAVNFLSVDSNLHICQVNTEMTGEGGLIANDFDNSSRSATAPTVGAIEYTGTYKAIPELGENQSICAGTSFDLTAGTYSLYAWNTGESTENISIENAGTYIITITDETACEFNDDIEISIFDYYLELGNDTSICDGETLILDAGNFETYVWSDLSTAQTLDISVQGKYTIEVIDSNSCTYHDTINVTMNPLPTVDLGNDTTICDGEYLEVSAGAGGTYLWNTGETDQIILVYTSGTYSVEYTNTYNCSAYDTINVNVVVCSGINELGEYYTISLYPNPAKNQITVKSENIIINKIDILDITGKTIKQLTMNNEQFTVDISDFQNGIYFIKINNTETLKFIKK